MIDFCQIARIASVAAFGFSLAPAANAALIIDDFMIGQGVSVIQPGPTDQHSNTATNPGLFGGDREFYIERDGSLGTLPQVADARMDAIGGVLDVQVRNDEKARTTVTYDGVGGGDTATSSFLGIPNQFNLDFDFSSYHAFSFVGGADLSAMGLPVYVRVYNADGTKWTEAKVNLQYLVNNPVDPNDDQGEFTYVLAFANFRNSSNSAADNDEIFGRLAGNTDVAGALQLAIGEIDFNNQNTGVDVSIQFLQASQVPEPGTMALLGAGLIGLVAIARKRVAKY